MSPGSVHLRKQEKRWQSSCYLTEALSKSFPNSLVQQEHMDSSRLLATWCHCSWYWAAPVAAASEQPQIASAWAEGMHQSPGQTLTHDENDVLANFFWSYKGLAVPIINLDYFYSNYLLAKYKAGTYFGRHCLYCFHPYGGIFVNCILLSKVLFLTECNVSCTNFSSYYGVNLFWF